MDMSEVEGSCLVIVEVEVNEYEGSVVLNDAEVDEVNEDGNLDDMRFDCTLVLDKSEVVIAVEVKDDCILDDIITIFSVELGEFEAVDLSEAEADEYGSSVESAEVKFSIVVVTAADSDGISVFIGVFVEKLVE